MGNHRDQNTTERHRYLHPILISNTFFIVLRKTDAHYTYRLFSMANDWRFLYRNDVVEKFIHSFSHYFRYSQLNSCFRYSLPFFYFLFCFYCTILIIFFSLFPFHHHIVLRWFTPWFIKRFGRTLLPSEINFFNIFFRAFVLTLSTAFSNRDFLSVSFFFFVLRWNSEHTITWIMGWMFHSVNILSLLVLHLFVFMEQWYKLIHLKTINVRTFFLRFEFSTFFFVCDRICTAFTTLFL